MFSGNSFHKVSRDDVILDHPTGQNLDIIWKRDKN